MHACRSCSSCAHHTLTLACMQVMLKLCNKFMNPGSPSYANFWKRVDVNYVSACMHM